MNSSQQFTLSLLPGPCNHLQAEEKGQAVAAETSPAMHGWASSAKTQRLGCFDPPHLSFWTLLKKKKSLKEKEKEVKLSSKKKKTNTIIDTGRWGCLHVAGNVNDCSAANPVTTNKGQEACSYTNPSWFASGYGYSIYPKCRVSSTSTIGLESTISTRYMLPDQYQFMLDQQPHGSSQVEIHLFDWLQSIFTTAPATLSHSNL